MTSQLHTLAYFSKNTIEDRGGELKAQIADILRAARANNGRQGVTGALLYSGGCFAQVLEGPQASIESVFENIQCDPRHTEVTILHYKPIEERSFGAWTMAFAGDTSTDHVPFDLQGLVSDPSRIESGQAGQDIVTVMRELIHRHETAHRDDLATMIRG